MSSERVPVIKQVAIAVDAETVIIEMICTSELAASVLLDDLTERLKTGKPVTITLTAGKVLEGDASDA